MRERKLKKPELRKRDHLHPLVQRLVALRYRQGLSQQDVADKLFVTVAAVGHFESANRDHRLSTLEAYCDAVGARLVVEAWST